MGKINYGRVVLGGLIAGIVMNIVYIVIIYMILKRREGHISWKDVLTDLKEGPA